MLKWDGPHEEKGKHEKFDHLWVGPCLIAAHKGDNAFILQYPDGSLVQRRHSEWEVSETLPGLKGLRSMYHSVNTFYVLVSIDGEPEDLKPMEKALISEEVTILLKFVFVSDS